MDADEIARVLSEHRYLHVNQEGTTGCQGCRWTTEATKGPLSRAAHERHLAAVLAPLVEQARQEGAMEALRAAADEVHEDNGAWDVLALYVDEAGHPYALAGIQRWLRDRAERDARTPGSGTKGGGS